MAVDWARVIDELERHHAELEIAIEVGKSVSWVSQLKRRIIREPSYSAGMALLAMHAASCAKHDNGTVS